MLKPTVDYQPEGEALGPFGVRSGQFADVCYEHFDLALSRAIELWCPGTNSCGERSDLARFFELPRSGLMPNLRRYRA